MVDTNIVLDLLVFSDPATAPLRALLAAGRLRWLATAAMQGELARVLTYPQIAPRLAFYRLEAAQVLKAYAAQVRWVDAAPRSQAMCKDADDQHFIDLAVAHRAILLSKDKAVLSLRKRLLAMGVQAASTLVLVSGDPDSPEPSPLTT